MWVATVLETLPEGVCQDYAFGGLACHPRHMLADVLIQGHFYFSRLSHSVPGEHSAIATRYGLDGPGIESRCGRDLPHPSKPTLGPTQPPVQWVPCIFPAGPWR
jgi:hypothetical protein